MQKWFRTLALPILALALVAAACSDDGGDSGDGGSASAAEECTSDIRVGVALDVGGLGDNGFNDLSKIGLDKAISEGVICESNTKFLEANSEGTNLDENTAIARRGRLRRRDRDRVRVHPGHQLDRGGLSRTPRSGSSTGTRPAERHAGSTTTPMRSRTSPTSPSRRNRVRSWWAWRPALKATELNCDTVGFLGGQVGPLIAKFEAGFTAGVHEVAPDVTVLVEYIGDTTKAFDDPTSGEALSNKMYDDGACIIYHAAG